MWCTSWRVKETIISFTSCCMVLRKKRMVCVKLTDYFLCVLVVATWIYLYQFQRMSLTVIFLLLEKLLIESNKSVDYEFLKKGSEKADGINDVEEFKITEVSV